MTDEWTRTLYAIRRRILDALDSPEVRLAVASKLDVPPFDAQIGPEMSFAETEAYDAALAMLEVTRG